MRASHATFVILLMAISFSCAPVEPTPQTIPIGMTKEQVVKKFGNPDLSKPRREVPDFKVVPTPTGQEEGLLGMVLEDMQGQVVQTTSIAPEEFRYFNRDGSLCTFVYFDEENRVEKVIRVPVKD